jgi:hypothetical protein
MAEETESKGDKHNFRQEIIKIILDKLLIALVLAFTGLITNYIIENIKSQNIKQQFVLEKKLEAIHQIKTSYDAMYSIYNNYTITLYQKMVNDNNKINSDYNNKIDDYMKTISNNNILVSETMREFIDNVLWLHTACFYLGITNTSKYRAFMNDVDTEYGIIIKKELGVIDKDYKDIFQFKKIPFKEVDKKDATYFLYENYSKWEKDNNV